MDFSRRRIYADPSEPRVSSLPFAPWNMCMLHAGGGEALSTKLLRPLTDAVIVRTVAERERIFVHFRQCPKHRVAISS